MGRQFLIHILLNLCSGSAGIKFEILVENSDTGSTSSLNAKMEHLFAFQF